jgi:hypothetical protein
MANNSNNNDNNEDPTAPVDWLSVTQKELDDASSPLGMLKGKPFSYFNVLTRNFVGNPNLFQANLGQFPQNFLVVTGPGSKVRIIHSLFSVNADPDSASSAIVVGIYGANKVAPFKTITAASAVLALTPQTRRGGGSKKDQEPIRIPSIEQFAEAESEEDFGDLVGRAEGEEVEVLGSYPSSHFLHPQIFADIEGKREWEAIALGIKLITLYENDDEEGIPTKLRGIHQLLAFLWAAGKQWGSPVTLREIPETGEVVSLCSRKATALEDRRSAAGPRTGGTAPTGEAMEQSHRLTEAMVLNLNKSSEAYVRQITKDDTTKSALSRLAPDQAALFSLLTAPNFETDGTPDLNAFTSKLTESRDPMRSINMVRQETRLWGGSISDKSLLQFLSSGYLAPDMNQEPDGLTSLGFVPHHERHKFEDKNNIATDNMRAMFGEKTFDEDSIKRYTKKQFFLPNRIEDWSIQLIATARFIDLLTCEDGIASEAYRTAQDLYEQNEQTFRAVFQADKLMGVKILHFLDRVFQEFATDLSRFAGLENPLREASASLRGRQRNTVIATLGSLKYGVKPTISLPPGLLPGQRTGGGTGQGADQGSMGEGASDGTGGGGAQSEGPRLKSVTLPEGWRVPRGKAFGDFFNPRSEETRANLTGWPLTTHDRTGTQKPMCLRLMVTGKCLKENCKNAHVKPTTLGPGTMDTISTRLAEIYRG